MNNVTLDALESLIKIALDNTTDADTRQTILKNSSLLREVLCDFSTLKTVITWNLDFNDNFNDGGKTDSTKAYIMIIPNRTKTMDFTTNEWERVKNPAFYIFEDILNNDYEE